MEPLGSTSALASACIAGPSAETAEALLVRLATDPSAGPSLPLATRDELVQTLLRAPPPRAPALALLKELTRLPAGTNTLANPEAIAALVADTASLARGDGKNGAAGEVALRILNNILLLHEPARALMLPHASRLVSILAHCSSELHKGSNQQALDAVFLASRVIFLCTVTPSPIISTLLSSLSTFTSTVKALADLPPGGRDLPLAESLRVVFNISLHAKGEDDWTPLLIVVAELIPSLSADARLVPPLSSALNALLNLPLASLPRQEGGVPVVLPSILDVLETALVRYLTRDSSPLRSLKPSPACAQDGLRLTEVLVPLFSLVRELVLATDTSAYVKQRWFPPTLDRSVQLRDRDDYRATLVRLLADDELKHATGAVLLPVCGGPQGLVDTIGYGPCAGFLLAAGLAGEVVPGLHSDEELDPITGAPPAPTQGGVGGTGMSEPEAAEEAARLMGTLDQLNRTGVVSVDTEAIRARALERHAVWEEDEAARQQEEEEKEEEEALRDLEAYKARKKRS